MSKIPQHPIIKPEAVRFETPQEAPKTKLARLFEKSGWEVQIRPTGLRSGKITFTRRF